MVAGSDQSWVVQEVWKGAHLGARGKETEMHSAGHSRVRERVERDRCLRIRQECAVEVSKTIFSNIKLVFWFTQL